MQVSANGLICIAGEIVEQRSGAWTARIEVDDEDNAITGPVTIKVGTESFVGTVVRGEVPDGKGRWIGHVVGGRGGLERELDAKYYFAATLQTIVQDALTAAGETLDAEDTEAGALATLMARWQRAQGRARLALSATAKKIGGFWRVNRAGRVVFRTAETWEEPDFEYESIDADPSDGTLEIAPDETPAARPGLTVGGHRIAAVTTRWAGDGVRQQLSIAAEDGSARGAGALFAEHIRKASESGINYSQWYPAKVVQQDPDGSLHVIPDDARVRGNGLTHVKMAHGLPGAQVTAQLGDRVRLFFENGDPEKPLCSLWEDADDATQSLVRGTQFAQALGTFLDGCMTFAGVAAIACDAASAASIGPLAALKAQFTALGSAFASWGGTPAGFVPLGGVTPVPQIASACGVLKARLVTGDVLSIAIRIR